MTIADEMQRASKAVRRERIATYIFAGMQANPHWTGSASKDGAEKAVELADLLTEALDAAT
jgi:hypothetical protein